MPVSFRASALYIFWILHQTTTTCVKPLIPTRCISFESYIKPQPQLCHLAISAVVYLLNPTSNHNLFAVPNGGKRVVYLLNPTSNHNRRRQWPCRWCVVYLLNPTSNHNDQSEALLQAEVVYLLNPTSNHNVQIHLPGSIRLYIFWILHQTTTPPAPIPCALPLYIFWILHQTTTYPFAFLGIPGCISFESYIKPQLGASMNLAFAVVYLLNPTSNHNRYPFRFLSRCVVYLLNPTSNHNCPFNWYVQLRLYIFWILHQTTTDASLCNVDYGCISFESYIKPQLFTRMTFDKSVVYLLNPTSNHNYLSSYAWCDELYIFWILHQTTTYEWLFRHA